MKRRKGQVIVEFALILPLLLLVLFGIIYSGLLFHDYVTLTNIARSGAREAAITTNEELQDGRYRNIETHYKNQIDTLMTSFYVKSNDPVIIEETEDQKGVRAIINMNLNVHGFFADMILPESFGVQYYMRKEPTS